MGKALEFKQKRLNESTKLVEEFNSTVGKWLKDAHDNDFEFPGWKGSDTAIEMLKLIFANYINLRIRTEAHVNNTLNELMYIFDMPARCRTDDLYDFVAELEDITLWDR
jgi:hypothetical protein